LLNINNGRGNDTCWLTNDDGLQLTSSSLCLDAGNNTYNNMSLDILLNPRLDNEIIDIGPYEYQSTTLSVIENINYEEISIYPNPTNSQITIIGDKSELAELKVFNTLGQDVSRATTILHRKDSTTIIDLSQLSNGIYFIKTKTTVNNVYKK